jgi:serine/threonine protein kinase
MTPAPGVRTGPYDIQAKIGQGGMGEVWEALDTRLNRRVAIKFCKIDFEARFEREAQAVAALNHPHICTLHDVGPGYLVMELIHGSPISGRLPFSKVIEYSGQILDALEAAHRAGIIHRDLKPANIYITREGVKLLDFRLASRDLGTAAGDSASTTAITARGQIVGTLQYMSPEQLQGQPVDKRSDLFSFGCVLYEMLTGRRAFDGGSAASVIAAILEREPEPMPEAPFLERIVRTCLAKNPEQRFQTASDLKRCLLWAAATPPETAPLRRFPLLPAALGAGGLLVGLFLGWLLLRPSQDSSLPYSRNVRITHDGQSFTPALSPDGKLVAYASSRSGSADFDVYVQQLSGKGTVRLTDHPARDTQPAFSADGSKIYFASLREPPGIHEVPALGGDARLVAAKGASPSVSPDGKWIAWLQDRKVFVRATGGGEARPVADSKFNEIRAVWPPDSTRLAVMQGGEAGLGLIPIDGSPPSLVPFVSNLRRLGMFEQGSSLVQGWTTQNDLIFSAPFGDAINIWRIPASNAGTAVPTAVTFGNSGLQPAIDVRGGKLVYTPNNSFQELWTLPADLDRGTVLGSLRQLPTEQSNAYHQDLTFDGKLLAYASRKGGTHGIWLVDMVTHRERLLFQAAEETESYGHLKFSPDGARIAATFSGYQGQGNDRRPAWYVVLLDVATGEARQLTKHGGRIRGWSPDGRFLVVWTPAPPSRVSTVDVQTGQFTPILSKPGTPLS